MRVEVETGDRPNQPMISIGATDYPEAPIEIVLDGIYTVDDESGEHRLPGLRFGRPAGNLTVEYDFAAGTTVLKGEITQPINFNNVKRLTLVGSGNVNNSFDWSASVGVRFHVTQKVRTDVSWAYKSNGEQVTKISLRWDFLA